MRKSRLVRVIRILIVVSIVSIFLSFLWNTSIFEVPMTISHNKQDEMIAKTEPGKNIQFDSNIRLKDLTQLQRFVVLANEEQVVRNIEKFGDIQSRGNPYVPIENVFVVQVHNRPSELRVLIESLRRVTHVEKSLIIFSHDYQSSEIDEIVDKVDFARTLRIFYPFAAQLFPKVFPGKDPDDCDEKGSEKVKPNCINRDWVDENGSYRPALAVQIKQHWIWKLHFVFTKVSAVRDFVKHIIFLEEDHFVVEDILHVKSLMELHLGNLSANTMLAFGSTDKHFCQYDDYNWDFTLKHIGTSCIKGGLSTLFMDHSIRVYHLGTCSGFHTKPKSANCSVFKLGSQLTLKLSSQSIMARLYPTKLNYDERQVYVHHDPPNGGWSDPRDQLLCKSIVRSSWLPEFDPSWTNWSQLSLMLGNKTSLSIGRRLYEG